MSKAKQSKQKSWTPKQWEKFHTDMVKIFASMSKELVSIKKGLVQVEEELDEQDKAYAKVASLLDLADSDSEGPFPSDGPDDGEPVPTGPVDDSNTFSNSSISE